MTHKERFLSVINSVKPDRIPFVPRLEIWYRDNKRRGTLPEKYRDMELIDIIKQLDVGHPGRETSLFDTVKHNIEVEVFMKGDDLYQVTKTPYGDLTESYVTDKQLMAELGISPTDSFEKFMVNGKPVMGLGQKDYMIKDESDYKKVKHIIENTEYIARYDRYNEYCKEVGDLGLCTTYSGYDPMFVVLHDYIGYNNAYLELCDNEELVEDLFRAQERKTFELQDILINSPKDSQVILHGEHYDTMMTPKPIFDKYMMPYMKAFSEKLDAVGKQLCVHSDADAKMLLGSFIDAGIRVADCFCTYPMATVTMEDALIAWEDKIVIWGGIPSNIVVPLSTNDYDFDSYIDNYFNLLAKYKHRVIVAIADNVMPEADMGRVEKIAKMAADFKY